MNHSHLYNVYAYYMHICNNAFRDRKSELREEQRFKKILRIDVISNKIRNELMRARVCV